MPKFGFEAEFAEGVTGMLPMLQSQGLLRDAEMHQYHCDCGACEFRMTGYALRAQTDSSCAGELISKPYGTSGAPTSEAYDVMLAIQEAAVQADAIPGPRAGFHVHVDARQLTDAQRVALYWQWVRWEPTMEAIATGPFRAMRDFNFRVRHNFMESVCYRDDAPSSMRYGEWNFDEVMEHWFPRLDEDEVAYMLESAYGFHYEADRHSLLAMQTRHETFEFRLWNSTRSAWRMELAARVSCAWMNPDVVTALAAVTPESTWPGNRTGDERNMRSFVEALRRTGEDERTLELLDRQVSYRVAHANDYEDPIFTAA